MRLTCGRRRAPWWWLANPALTGRRRWTFRWTPLPATAGAAFERPVRVNGELDLRSPLTPGEVRVFRYDRAPPIATPWSRGTAAALQAAPAPRIAIEAVAPAVDAGQFPVKRLAGDAISVTADIFADGHEMLAAALLWRPADEADWQREPMPPTLNDRWEASFTPARVGRYAFVVEAWWDEWGTLRRDWREAGSRAGRRAECTVDEACALLRQLRCRNRDRWTWSRADRGAAV